jgi:hypothetical protein
MMCERDRTSRQHQIPSAKKRAPKKKKDGNAVGRTLERSQRFSEKLTDSERQGSGTALDGKDLDYEQG